MYQVSYGFQDKDDNSRKKEALSIEEVKLSVVNDIGESVFDYEQMQQIRSGLENRLCTEKVKLYIAINGVGDAVLDSEQMEQIRLGLQDKDKCIDSNKSLSIKQVKSYNVVEYYDNEVFNDVHMRQIRYGLENRLYIEKVRLYAIISGIGDAVLDSGYMEQIRLRFQDKGYWRDSKEVLSTSEFKLYTVLKDMPVFDCNQIDEIILGLEHGLGIEKVSVYSNPHLSFQIMRITRLLLESGVNYSDYNVDKYDGLGGFMILF